MAKKVASFRLDVELLDWLTGYAKSRGSTQAVLVESAVREFKALAEGGVPDLPADRQERAVAVTGGRVRRASELVPALESNESIMKARQARLNKKMGWSGS